MRTNKTYQSAVAFLNNQCRRDSPSLLHAITVKAEKDIREKPTTTTTTTVDYGWPYLVAPYDVNRPSCAELRPTISPEQPES